MHLGPPRIIRFPRLRKSLDDPPAVLKRDPRRIRVPQIDDPRQRVRLRHAHRQLRLMERRHALRVLLLSSTRTRMRIAPALPVRRARHLAAGAHVRREQRQVLEQHTLLTRAEPKRQRRRDVHVRFLRRHCGGQGHALCRRVGRELFGAHEDLGEVAGGPFGAGLFVVARDGAEDDVGSRRSRLFLELFSLREVLLSCETGLSFSCGLYTEDSGGMEGSAG